MKKRLRLSRDILSLLVMVITPFFRGDRKKGAWGFLALLLSLLILVSVVNVFQNYVSRDWMNAITDRDRKAFFHWSFIYAGCLGLSTVIAVYYRYTEERLALLWREWMTGELMYRYFADRNYFKLRFNPNLDNPDQRIAEDIRNFTSTSLSLFLIFLNSSITLIAFVGVLYSISSLLVLGLVVYTFIGTFFTFRIGRKLIRIYNRQYAREANFRYGLVRIRDNSESIAFYRGERRERLDLGRRFRDLLRNSRFLIIWNRNLGIFTTGYNNFALILPALLLSPLYFSSDIKFGVIAQATGAFAQVLAATSILITQFERVSAYTAQVYRIGGLWNGIIITSADEGEEEIIFEESKRLQLQKVSIRPPDSDNDLISDLTLTLRTGKGVLIMGPSGCGKSSILRTIAGLWGQGSGTIRRPKYRDMMFLPQKPYMPPGNLRSQLLYPLPQRDLDDDKIKAVIDDVNLQEVFDRVKNNLDAILDWGNILSLGEQQRISFARLFLRQPAIAFLDEATSALDEDNEQLMYNKLRELGHSFVSVGHRSSLIQFHDYVLQIGKNGMWTWEKTDNIDNTGGSAQSGVR